MNFNLASDKENVGKHVGSETCLFCKKVFDNRRALGGHFKVHKKEIWARKSWNYPDHSSNSIGSTSTNLSSLFNSQTEDSSGDARNNLSALPSRATSLPDLSKRFWSNETARLNLSKFSENNLENLENNFIPSPNLSSGSSSTEVCPLNNLSSTALAPFSSRATTDFPSDSSICLGLNGVFQFNSDEFRTCMDGMQLYTRDALLNFQHHNLSTLSYLGFSSGNPDPGLGLNGSPHWKESSNIGSLPPELSHHSSQDKVTLYNKSGVFTWKKGKWPYLGDVSGNNDMMKALKKPRINSHPPNGTKESQQRELPLIKDMENTISTSVMSFVDKEDSHADVDLSLHL